MTPDKARDLLDNFDQLLPFEAELAMEGAAKDMAAMIAGMQREYGVRWAAIGNFPERINWGFDTLEKAHEHSQEATLSDETPGTILVRYVTEPEAVE